MVAFTELPNELLLEILSFLDATDLCRTARVNRQLNALASVPTLWDQLGISDIQQQIVKTQNQFESFLERFYRITDETINEALQICPAHFLRNIHIRVDSPRECLITGRALDAIVRKNPHLLSLHLNTTDVQQFENITDDDVVAFAKAAKKLESISLMRCPQITARGFQAISAASCTLQRISFQSDALTDVVVQSILHNHPRLKLLRLAGRPNHVTTASLEVISQNCQSIEELDIRLYNQPFSIRGVCKLLPNLLNVSHLSFHGTKRVTNKMIFTIAKHLPKIRSLYLSNCSHVAPRSIVTIARRLIHLESLYLIGCKNPKKLTKKFEEQKQKGYFAILSATIT